jgi:hypothetical protein
VIWAANNFKEPFYNNDNKVVYEKKVIKENVLFVENFNDNDFYKSVYIYTKLPKTIDEMNSLIEQLDINTDSNKDNNSTLLKNLKKYYFNGKLVSTYNNKFITLKVKKDDIRSIFNDFDSQEFDISYYDYHNNINDDTKINLKEGKFFKLLNTNLFKSLCPDLKPLCPDLKLDENITQKEILYLDRNYIYVNLPQIKKKESILPKISDDRYYKDGELMKKYEALADKKVRLCIGLKKDLKDFIERAKITAVEFFSILKGGREE